MADQRSESESTSLDLEALHACLKSASTSRRISQLKSLPDELSHRELSDEETSYILQVLFDTHPLYRDRPSRRAVQSCLKIFLKNLLARRRFSPFVERLKVEVTKPGIAPTSAFVLVEWCASLLQECATTSDLWETWALDLLKANALALDLCHASSLRQSLKRSASVVTARALRMSFAARPKNIVLLREAVEALTSGDKTSSAVRNAVLLGIAAKICAESPQARQAFEDLKPSYYSFYVREILGSRVVVPEHIAKALKPFFFSFATEDGLRKEIVPALEKALLRAPEVVLRGMLSSMAEALPDTIDLSTIVHTHLLKPLLSNIKSTNVAVRNGAVVAFQSLARRCINESVTNHIGDDLLGPLRQSKITNPEQKAAHCQMLASMLPSKHLARAVPAELCQVAGKELSEVALEAETLAITTHLWHSIVHYSTTDQKPVELCARGLAEKRPIARRIWALRAGEVLWRSSHTQLKSPEMLIFVNAITAPLQQIWSDVNANPLQAVSTGLYTAALVVIAAFRSRLYDLDDAVQAAGDIRSILAEAFQADKTPFLLNARIYTKLQSRDDLTWFLRSIAAVTDGVASMADEVAARDLWAQAFLYLIATSSISGHIRRDARQALSAAYVSHPASVSRMVIKALWNWQRHVERAEKETAALASKTGVDCIHLVLQSICLRPDEIAQLGGNIRRETLEEQQVALAIICRPEMFPRANWIGACQIMGIDPGDLVGKYATQLLNNITEITGKAEEYTSAARKAAFSAAAEFAFVAPDVFTPILVEQIQHDLDPESIPLVSSVDAAIFRTPEGTAYVDVLAQKDQSYSQNRNERDHDILQWEEELRKQLAQKKGEQRKLSKDEQSRLDAQLAKEAAIRSNLRAIAVRLDRGYGLIQSLGVGPPTQAEDWMWHALDSILKTVSRGSGLLMGIAPAEAYLACAEKATSRLGSLRSVIGAATLRCQPMLQVPGEYEEEAATGKVSSPLYQVANGLTTSAEQMSRVLYRLRLAAEQRPFDLATVLYIMPLIITVLRQGGNAKAKGEDVDVQVVLALELLEIHTETYSNERLPRKEILSVLISSMQTYKQHHKLVRDCLLKVCKCIALNLTEEELKVLLKGALAPELSARNTVLQAIDDEFELTDYGFLEEMWLACHDDAEENAELGRTIWAANSLKLDDTSAQKLLPYLESADAHLRSSAARSLAEAVELVPSSFPAIISQLQDLYIAKNKPVTPEHDQYGRRKKPETENPWEARSGVALAFKEMSANFQTSHLASFIRFLISDGPLGDPNATVRSQMIDAAISVIARSGREQVEQLMQTFEATLEALDKGSEQEDRVKEAVIILYGALARHLNAGDPRLPKVLQRLLVTLETPSEPIQYAVAECLPPLVRASGGAVSGYVEDLLDKLLNSKTYAARRGAAYGLAGVVLGKGISTLREYRILSKLQTAIDNKKNPNHRQGALFAYELFSMFLGKLFEPYIIKVVPQLLAAFGDSDADVRDACLDAAKACFTSLTSYGVKQILPPLLEGLDDSQWRSKKGACDLLGAMAYLDPQQLAQSLPDIIPPLTNVLNDSHKEVRAAAKRSLQRFGEVISTPEMKGVVSILLKAISDPIKHTDEALDSLIKVSFVHYLDAPSLALVVRILERGLGDRSATKRKSAQIIGSLSHLTERKDLMVHLRILVGGLRVAILDPVPTTRATASKALGSLMEKLGEESLPDLIPSLMSTLKSETGAGDRLGSAQALSEVLAGLGTARLEETLPTILENASSSHVIVREGFMTLFIFLPACFGNTFSTYLSKVIPPILAGLADEVESIRETSLRAGRLLVRSYATRAVDLLLPELERGLADDNYRIRLSSVELVGDLLFTLSGKTGNVEHEETEEDAGDTGQSLVEVLGVEKRARVLSLLYICRCDTSALVRNAAVSVWKVMVSSPRVLKELVPTLTQLLIRRLASSNMEQKLIAGNALGELVRKAGDGLMTTLLPMLQDVLETSTDANAKQGVCIAIRELTASATAEALQEHEKALISIVRTALVDHHEEVRESAAEAFDSVQRIFGKRAVDQILPQLLGLLRLRTEADSALSALLTLLKNAGRSNLILPNLLPTLLTPPISAFNAKALALLSQVAGPALTRRLPQILNGIMENSVLCNDEELRAEMDSSFDAILMSIDEYDGLNSAMSTMIALAKHEDHKKRAAADYRLAHFFMNAEVNYSRYHADLIRVLLISFDDRDPDVVKASLTALSALTSRLKKEEMEVLVIPSRQVLQGVGVKGANLPGFSLPKGINAVLPIFLQGLINGTTEQRIQAALAISDIVDRTSAEALRPAVTQITGPLIRVISERPGEVKAAILLTLNNLLEKIPAFLKPFLPQLQRTFARALADTSSEVSRARAAKALTTLVSLTPRVDQLISELIAGSRSADPGVRNAMLKALADVVSTAGKNMGEGPRASLLGLVEANLNEAEDEFMDATARLLGALMKYLPDPETKSLLRNRVLINPPSPASVLCLNSVLLESAPLMAERFLAETATVIRQGISSKNSFVSDNSVLAAGKFLLSDMGGKTFELTKGLVETLAGAIAPENPPDTRRLALVVVRTVARVHSDLIRPHVALLAPPVYACVRDSVVPVKLSAEAAFLALFSAVEHESSVFDKYMATGAGADLPAAVKRGMQDYFKRVTLRLASQARERQDGDGGILADEKEDEQEIWGVGKVDLGYFGDE